MRLAPQQPREEEMHIETLSPARLRDAAEVLAEAYADEPIIGRMIPLATDDRPNEIAEFFVWSMLHTGYDSVDIVLDAPGGTVLGVAIWEPPNHEPRISAAASALERVMRGIGAAGWDTLQRFDDASTGKHPEGAWHLVDIGTARNARGTGAGSRLLRHRLAEIDARGDMASLEATTAASALIYERFGFVRTHELDGVADGVTVMWREPHPIEPVGTAERAAEPAATQPVTRTDVLIVGGGLAGLAAADTLRDSGLQVTLLDANTRLGGRTWGMHWEPAGRMIDLGGTWLLPSFTRTFALLEEFGIGTVESPASDQWFTHFRRGVVTQRYLGTAEFAELERALALITAVVEGAGQPLTAADALRIVAERDDAPSALVEDWQRAMQRYLAGAPLSEVDAEHLLLDINDIADPEHYHTQVAGTTQALIDAYTDRITAEIRLQTRAVSVTRDPEGVRVTTADGAVCIASDVILAIPLNCLGALSLDPELLGDYSEIAAAGHAGRARKDWFVLDGVPDHFRVFASEGPYGYFRSEALLADGGMLAVGLTPSAEGAPSLAELETEIRTHYLPNATIRAHFSHDWNADAAARGTWYVPRPGQYRTLAALRAGDPHVAIVGGDVDGALPGTLEGAIVSGETAAAAILARLTA